MRARSLSAPLAILTTLWVARVAAEPADRAAASSPGEAAEDPNGSSTERARRHFQNGIKLFRSSDFPGALAEFEASYRDKPGAPSLQNIGLCLKELHRYAEAATALETLLQRHASELSEPERTAVNKALAELEELTATLLLSVTPPEAKVTIDGRAPSPAERTRGVRVSVGEHTIAAEAPGYQRTAQSVRVSSGDKRTMELRLRLVSGLLSVTTGDPDAAIALDGTPLAFEHWRGPVSPGEHYVQVYKPGFEAFEKRLSVALGQIETIAAPPLGKADEPAPTPAPTSDQGSHEGWYALGTVGVMGMLDTPLGLDQQSATVQGNLLGLRGGYRLIAPIGVELMLEAGKNRVTGACMTRAAGTAPSTSSSATRGDCDDNQDRVNYELGSARIGPNLRLMSTGASLRFASSLGAGVVIHQLDFENKVSGASKTFKGQDLYFLIEAGAQVNIGHLLLEAAASFYMEGTSSVSKDDALRFDPAVLKMIGIGVRGGFSQWRPPKH